MIPRSVTAQLISLTGFFPVVGIIGPRQVGKTTLSKVIEKSLQKPVIYLDIENPRDQAKIQDPVLFFESNIDKCIILDEIQRMPQLFPVLRSMIDMKREPGRYFILGSATPALIRDSSESLAGRIAFVELTPFNLTEISGDRKGYKNHWYKGGFPDAYLSPDNELCYQWHYNFVKTYIERDLPILGLNADKLTLMKLWTMMAHMQGNIINMSNLGRSLELSSTTIKKYINFLENAFLLRQLQPYATNIKKRLVKSPKVYIRDSGVFHYLLNISSFVDLEFNPIVGNSWEGYVIEQILQLAEPRVAGYFYRTHEGAECDLVLVLSGKPLAAIEIKYSSGPSITKSMVQSFADLGARSNFIITPDADDYLVRKDIRVCNLFDFVTRYLPELIAL